MDEFRNFSAFSEQQKRAMNERMLKYVTQESFITRFTPKPAPASWWTRRVKWPLMEARRRAINVWRALKGETFEY